MPCLEMEYRLELLAPRVHAGVHMGCNCGSGVKVHRSGELGPVSCAD